LLLILPSNVKPQQRLLHHKAEKLQRETTGLEHEAGYLLHTAAVLDNDGTDWCLALPLKRLYLTHFDSSASLLQAIAENGLPESLELLALDHSAINDGNVDTLLKMKPLLQGVQRINLFETAITKGYALKLEDLGPEIWHYRYVVGME
jgi:hypothetical protein